MLFQFHKRIKNITFENALFIWYIFISCSLPHFWVTLNFYNVYLKHIFIFKIQKIKVEKMFDLNLWHQRLITFDSNLPNFYFHDCTIITIITICVHSLFILVIPMYKKSNLKITYLQITLFEYIYSTRHIIFLSLS